MDTGSSWSAGVLQLQCDCCGAGEEGAEDVISAISKSDTGGRGEGGRWNMSYQHTLDASAGGLCELLGARLG